MSMTAAWKFRSSPDAFLGLLMMFFFNAQILCATLWRVSGKWVTGNVLLLESGAEEL
jgi:hypothetical protein